MTATPTRLDAYEAERRAYFILAEAALDVARVVVRYGTEHPYYADYAKKYEDALGVWLAASEAYGIAATTEVSVAAVRGA